MYPIISLLIFFLFFVVLTVYVLSMKKSTVKLLSEIPLDDEQESTNHKN
ncbi:MAG TPA: CcoQ/FixQ family Cbb3-type cytochrome c oxidase assembly chaperone [Chitinophagaceae bacterium]|nr:CcoQ/FixQ family Cbb3-type cytochrome c oxidase assembly chaperone [Chitinophagaceae bacterium]